MDITQLTKLLETINCLDQHTKENLVGMGNGICFVDAKIIEKKRGIPKRILSQWSRTKKFIEGLHWVRPSPRQLLINEAIFDKWLQTYSKGYELKESQSKSISPIKKRDIGKPSKVLNQQKLTLHSLPRCEKKLTS